MLNKANFLVTEFASKEESRYALTAIQVRPEATVATNGHYLAWISTDSADPQNFPVVEGFEGGQKHFKPFLLDVESAKAIAKALPRKTTIPVLQYAAVHVNGVTVESPDGTKTQDQDKGIQSVSLAVTDLERPQVFRPRVPEGQFPKFEQVIPDWEKDVAFEISVDPAYLATIAKSALDFQKGKAKPILRMKFYTPDKAIRFDATNDNGQGMTVVLMPMRDEKDLPGTYGYKEREYARQEVEGLKHMPLITLTNVIRRMKENEDYPEGTIESLQAITS